MGKKKGGGKNKLARMSEEERARYLQHRADVEEEAKRRKQQLIAMYMKNKLKREDAFTRLNLAKINQEWRFILRQVKCKEMRGEIKIMENLFNDCIDRKNRVIRRLLGDLDESEEIYSTMLHTHMETIEKLIQIHRSRLNYFKDSYEKQKKTILENNRKDIERYRNEKSRLHKEVECVYYGLVEKSEAREKIEHEKHLKKVDDLKNAMSIKLENLTKEREKQMEQLWKEFQFILTNYVRHKEQYRNEYIDLRQKDSEETRSIKNHYLEVTRLTELISEQKSQYDTIKDDHEYNLKQLGKYKKELQDKYAGLKKEFEANIDKDKENFKFMCVQSENTLKTLCDLLKKGEILLQMCQISRKMETEEEKILPFGPQKKIFFGLDETQLREIPDWFHLNVDNDATDHGPARKQNELVNYDMNNFWKRYNTIRIDCVTLEHEKQQLKNDNFKLKETLKDYLTNINISSGAGVEINDGYFVKRPHSMKIEKMVHIDLTKSTGVKPIKRRPVTCIEANLSVAVRTHKLVANRNRLPQCFAKLQIK